MEILVFLIVIQIYIGVSQADIAPVQCRWALLDGQFQQPCHKLKEFHLRPCKLSFDTNGIDLAREQVRFFYLHPGINASTSAWVCARKWNVPSRGECVSTSELVSDKQKPEWTWSDWSSPSIGIQTRPIVLPALAPHGGIECPYGETVIGTINLVWRADDGGSLYVDGELIASTVKNDHWRSHQIKASARIVAFETWNDISSSGPLALLHNVPLTDVNRQPWKCAEGSAPADWFREDFDDSDWSNAKHDSLHWVPFYMGRVPMLGCLSRAYGPHYFRLKRW